MRCVLLMGSKLLKVLIVGSCLALPCMHASRRERRNEPGQARRGVGIYARLHRENKDAASASAWWARASENVISAFLGELGG